jgi:hypothetical protein
MHHFRAILYSSVAMRSWAAWVKIIVRAIFQIASTMKSSKGESLSHAHQLRTT